MAKNASTLAMLRTQADTILELPEGAQGLIERYSNLHIKDARTATPYHINCRLFSRNRALVGKGTPDEIERTATRFFDVLHTTIHPGDSQGLKAALRDYGIGIDCSGFAAWIMHEITTTQLGKPIWKCLRFPSAKRHAVSRIRPIENISAALLTGERNTHTLTAFQNMRPGDLIRALRGNHVLIITEVGKREDGRTAYFCYAHSTTGNEHINGVSKGWVELSAEAGRLADQRWHEEHQGLLEAPALLTVKSGGDDSRIVRLRALQNFEVSHIERSPVTN